MSTRGRIVALVFLAWCLPAAASPAAVPSWTTYRHDAARSGLDPDSSSPVAPAQSWQSSLDGPVYGQPLVYGSTVYVATENDTVYALSSTTGAVIWQQHLATPVPSAQLPCGDISPTVGITSTPVIDPAVGRIFVVGDTWDGTNIKHDLFGLNLSDGNVAVGPQVVDPPGSTPANQLQRAALALDAGKVIIGEGGNAGDCGTYHGWLVAVPEAGGALQTFEVDGAGGENEGAIWGSGNAPAIDSSGDAWISTGNGDSTSFDYQESVIKLDPNMNVLDHWAPSNWASLDSSDADLGSTMPVLLPGGLVFEIGKAGVGYLLSASGLGGTGGAPVYQASVCGGSWGGGIYENGVIYVTCSNGVHALALNTTTKTFAPVSGWNVNSSAVGPPIAAGGLIWSAGPNNGVLYGLDPATGATRFSSNLGSFEHFTTPSAGGGRLFVANGSDVTAFQIASPPGAAPTSTALSSSLNPAGIGQAVTLTASVTPAPDGGTVSFTDGGAALAGCAAVAVSAVSGQAACTTAFTAAGTHAIAASYAGDAFYAGSSATLSESVQPAAQSPGGGSSGTGTPGSTTGATTGTGTSAHVVPVLSRLRVRLVHRRLRLTLTLSERARVTVTVFRLVPGRVVRHSCRAGARRGRRCRARVRRAMFVLAGRRGTNSLEPRMRQLPLGSYLVVVTARDARGARSKRHALSFAVRPRRSSSHALA